MFASLSSAAWTPVLANLRSICFDNEDIALDTLPELFKEAYNLEFISIIVGRIGTAEEPLKLLGASVRPSRLFLGACAGAMYVHLPSCMKCSNIRCAADSELDVRQASAWLSLIQCCAHTHSAAFCVFSGVQCRSYAAMPCSRQKYTAHQKDDFHLQALMSVYVLCL